MRQTDLLTFRVTGRADLEPRTRRLGDEFFAALPQETLAGGDVQVTLEPQCGRDSLLTLRVRLEGCVTVTCDRCLEPVCLPVRAEETLRIALEGSPEAEADPDVLTADVRTGLWNAAWTLYEICETSLPLTRVHAEGECTGDVPGFIAGPDEA